MASAVCRPPRSAFMCKQQDTSAAALPESMSMPPQSEDDTKRTKRPVRKPGAAVAELGWNRGVVGSASRTAPLTTLSRRPSPPRRGGVGQPENLTSHHQTQQLHPTTLRYPLPGVPNPYQVHRLPAIKANPRKCIEVSGVDAVKQQRLQTLLHDQSCGSRLRGCALKVESCERLLTCLCCFWSLVSPKKLHMSSFWCSIVDWCCDDRPPPERL
jgi:hypothetical protein